MRYLKTFEEYLKEGVVKKQTKNIMKAKSLIANSDETYKMLHIFIKSAKVTDESSNYIVNNCYDSIMQRVRSKMIEEGYNSTGNFAHEAEVSYMRILGFSENDVILADTLRYSRNGILYYGTKTDKEFAEKVLKLLEKVKMLK